MGRESRHYEPRNGETQSLTDKGTARAETSHRVGVAPMHPGPGRGRHVERRPKKDKTENSVPWVCPVGLIQVHSHEHRAGETQQGLVCGTDTGRRKAVRPRELRGDHFRLRCYGREA